MQLVQRWPNTKSTFRNEEYFCDLTTELDKLLAGSSDLYKVYIYDCRDKYDKKNLALRVPGCTVGHIEVDEHMIIVGGEIAPHGRRKFHDAPNEVIQRFIGEQLIFPAEGV